MADHVPEFDDLEQRLDELLRLTAESEVGADGMPTVSIDMVIALARMVDQLEQRVYDPSGHPGDSTLH